MANANVCLQEGTVFDVRYSINVDSNLEQADFWLKQLVEDQNGVVRNNQMLCRVLGKTASILKDLDSEVRVIVEGKLRYKDYLGYVEGKIVSHDRDYHPGVAAESE